MEQGRPVTYSLSIQDESGYCYISGSGDPCAEEWTVEYDRPTNSPAAEGHARNLATISRILLAVVGLGSSGVEDTSRTIQIEIPY